MVNGKAAGACVFQQLLFMTQTARAWGFMLHEGAATTRLLLEKCALLI